MRGVSQPRARLTLRSGHPAGRLAPAARTSAKTRPASRLCRNCGAENELLTRLGYRPAIAGLVTRTASLHCKTSRRAPRREFFLTLLIWRRPGASRYCEPRVSGYLGKHLLPVQSSFRLPAIVVALYGVTTWPIDRAISPSGCPGAAFRMTGPPGRPSGCQWKRLDGKPRKFSANLHKVAA